MLKTLILVAAVLQMLDAASVVPYCEPLEMSCTYNVEDTVLYAIM